MYIVHTTERFESMAYSECGKNPKTAGIEPGTFRVLGERDNRYTMETDLVLVQLKEVVMSQRSDLQPVTLTPLMELQSNHWKIRDKISLWVAGCVGSPMLRS